MTTHLLIRALRVVAVAGAFTFATAFELACVLAYNARRRGRR